jgi:hypothetical protein
MSSGSEDVASGTDVDGVAGAASGGWCFGGVVGGAVAERAGAGRIGSGTPMSGAGARGTFHKTDERYSSLRQAKSTSRIVSPCAIVAVRRMQLSSSRTLPGK